MLLAASAASLALADERLSGFADPLLGRWDLTIESEDGPYPAWLELRLRTELQLMGRFVGRVGSVRYLSAIDYTNGQLELAVPVQYEPSTADLEFEARLVGDRLEGTTLAENGKPVRWTGDGRRLSLAAPFVSSARQWCSSTARISLGGYRAPALIPVAGASPPACSLRHRLAWIC